MVDYRWLAQMVKALNCGASPNDVLVTADGVFFVIGKPARTFAERYGGQLIELKENPIGWFVQSKPESGADDPLIATIKKALADAGVTSNSDAGLTSN